MDSFVSLFPAPVSGRAETHVDAPPARVFALISDVLMWPAWDDGVAHTAAHGGLGPDAEFEWLADGRRFAARVRMHDPVQRICWSARTIGQRQVTSWEIVPKGAGADVVLEESRAGMLAMLMPGHARRAVEEAVATRLAALKKAAERRMTRAA